MKQETLLAKFNAALIWNGLSFLFTRLSKLALTLTVYQTLTTTDFATWANVLSMVFIAALWADFGLRRSVLRYCPEFSHNSAVKRRFIIRLICAYSLLLVAANIIFIQAAPQISTLMNLQSAGRYFSWGCIMFAIESLRNLIRLILYAHFWNKQVNLLETLVTGSATIFLLAASLRSPASRSLLELLFTTHIVSSSIILLATICMLALLQTDPDYQHNEPINELQLTKDFALHSGFMWVMLSANSLTERNVLVPLFTIIFGHTAGNLFKVANDAALLFQRFIVKVIGMPGVSLFSHIESRFVRASHSGGALFRQMLGYYHRRLITLVVPSLGAAALIMMAPAPLVPVRYHHALPIFGTLTSFYLVHLLLMGFTDLLGVKRDYKLLTISLLPMAGMPLVYYASASRGWSISLLSMISIIHSCRLSIFIIRAIMAHKKYRTGFPVRYLVGMASVTGGVVALMKIIIF